MTDHLHPRCPLSSTIIYHFPHHHCALHCHSLSSFIIHARIALEIQWDGPLRAICRKFLIKHPAPKGLDAGHPGGHVAGLNCHRFRSPLGLKSDLLHASCDTPSVSKRHVFAKFHLRPAISNDVAVVGDLGTHDPLRSNHLMKRGG